MDTLSLKDQFILAAKEIKRPGIETLMTWLDSSSSDFYTAPASTRFHGSYEGGLCEHSLNVYSALISLVHAHQDLFNLKWSDETLLIVSLFHDLCKVNLYKLSTKNVKDEEGKWTQVPSYVYDDQMPYGHGEKSVYIINGFMRLTREEAFAIRYHMGAFGDEPKSNVGKAFEMYPLALYLHMADQIATVMMESKKK